MEMGTFGLVPWTKEFIEVQKKLKFIRELFREIRFYFCHDLDFKLVVVAKADHFLWIKMFSCYETTT